MAKRFICVHGHFYQPPRENPRVGKIELQESAYPYYDWNERINAECYAPNTTSRILDSNGKTLRVVNNYEKISFNFGPTLLSWLQWNSPSVYQNIIDVNRKSLNEHSGHGNAMAQAYNHMIMPLANKRDKHTQVIWGIKDFQYRFQRFPEGMWLPETAVDQETLKIMYEHGIFFTILSPGQAKRIRPLNQDRWVDVSNGSIDTTMPYLVRLSSGGQVNIFFYNSKISHEVAFGELLNSGKDFSKRLLDAFPERDNNPLPIVHIATDGETYGHHHKFGEMALSYALANIEKNTDVRLTNYGEYLAFHQATHEVEIIDNTSWSCIHGVERWRADCGCRIGSEPGWNQLWRVTLREGLDWLRNRLIKIFEELSFGLLKNPWKARDEYIDVILDSSETQKERFFQKHSSKALKNSGKIQLLNLLEMQKNAMFMYTSCGWFFDDISRIESIQILRYAGRALELAEGISGEKIEEGFLEILANANSNIRGRGNGADIYKRFVIPSKDSVNFKTRYSYCKD